MEKELIYRGEKELIIWTTPTLIAKGLRKFLEENPVSKPALDFEKDRLSKKQAAKFAGISIPTLSKHVSEGKFIEHNLGRRKYFLKSEMIESLRNDL